MGEILNTCVIGKPVSDEFDTLLTLSLKKLPMLFYFNYQRLNYFV